MSTASVAINPNQTNQVSLNEEDSKAWLELLCTAGACSIPLSEVLRDEAKHTSSKALRSALDLTSDMVTRGVDPMELLRSGAIRLGSASSEMVLTLLKSGASPTELEEWLIEHEDARIRRSDVLTSLIYPLTLAFTAVLFFLIGIRLLTPVHQMLSSKSLNVSEVGASVGSIVQSLASESIHVAFSVVAILFAVLLFALTLRLVFKGLADWLLTLVPIIGPIWIWTSYSLQLRSLAVLVRQGMPLGKALNLIADAFRSSPTSYAMRRFAQHVNNGGDPAQWLLESKSIPPSVSPFFRWGERSGTLPSAIVSAARMLNERAQARADYLSTILPPISLALVSFLIVGFYFIFYNILRILASPW